MMKNFSNKFLHQIMIVILFDFTCKDEEKFNKS